MRFGPTRTPSSHATRSKRLRCRWSAVSRTHSCSPAMFLSCQIQFADLKPEENYSKVFLSEEQWSKRKRKKQAVVHSRSNPLPQRSLPMKNQNQRRFQFRTESCLSLAVPPLDCESCSILKGHPTLRMHVRWSLYSHELRISFRHSSGVKRSHQSLCCHDRRCVSSCSVIN